MNKDELVALLRSMGVKGVRRDMSEKTLNRLLAEATKPEPVEFEPLKTPNEYREHSMREAWLVEAVDKLRPLLRQAGAVVPDKILISVGFAFKRAATTSANCYTTQAGGGVNHIFVAPTTVAEVEVLSYLTHELIHASDDNASGHNGHFKKVHTVIGFTGKATGSQMGPELQAQLEEIASELGPYPHKKLNPGGSSHHKKQSTRMLKLSCARCKCIIRTSSKWADTYEDDWRCPCGGR